MPRALILGGTGLIGGAVARRLLANGWEVDVSGRNPVRVPSEIAAAGGRFVAADRGDDAQLRAALGDGADLLVDCVCYTAAHARLLLPLAEDAASTVLISSRAVYVDDEGNHSNSDVPPRFDGPIRETRPTLAAGDMDYRSREGYGPNKVAAEHVALDSGLPITVIRPAHVHGVGAARPREWVFVKRVLDGRGAVLLARGGAGLVHTTAAANIASLVETVAARPGARILNCADPDAPSVLEISRVVARHFGHAWEEVLLDGTVPDGLGRTPWDSPHPVVLDTSAAEELGYRPAGDYATTVAAELDWLSEAARSGDQAGILPKADDPYFSRFFDYAAEDAFLAGRTR
ncbi:NAD-dependent epimerase/dehydratase family protein [Actinomadura roseirufa]|uniref:NAD-dependent epimerase/dehydratase family protein n=1 Tax=Actinomadura roseirufa TaxID=2094049 RepID=UPI001041B6EE|nr:NAD-dependent epimerase/dehydratase family protein [Actinomadura roseirufa]